MSPAQHSAALRSFEAQWLARDARRPRRRCASSALQRFLQLGLPTSHDESWRYTNLRPLAAQSFVDAPRAAARISMQSAARAEPRGRCSGERHDARPRRCVLVNGYPLLPRRRRRTGVEIRTLSALARENPDLAGAPSRAAARRRGAALAAAQHRTRRRRAASSGSRARSRRRCSSCTSAPRSVRARRPIRGSSSRPRPVPRATMLEHHIQHGAESPLEQFRNAARARARCAHRALPRVRHR